MDGPNAVTTRDGTRRRRAIVAGGIPLALLAGCLAVLPTQHAAASGGLDVFAGYADSTHVSAAFPTPWRGSSGVTFEGCSTGCTFDGGAVRVVNNTTGPHTVGVVLHLSTCTFDLWPHNTVIPAGGQLIVAQTTSGFTDGCATNGNMDTSDIGPNGVSWSGHCNQSSVVPTIDVIVDGTTTTFTDSGQVLNTGGIDKGSCTSGGENTQWTPVGNVPSTPTMTGRAYGAAAGVHLLGIQTAVLAPTPDTGEVMTTGAATTTTPCVVTLSGVVTGGVLCANVTTSLGPPTSVATASVAHASIATGLVGVPLITVTTVASNSTSTCAGSSGGATIVALTVGGVGIVLPPTLKPNMQIPLVVGTLTLNEQIPVPGGLTVNALHLHVNKILGTDADVVLASSTSDIHDC